MALGVASAYYTVSNAAIMVVAGIIPIYLLADERAEIEEARKRDELVHAKQAARVRTMEK